MTLRQLTAALPLEAHAVLLSSHVLVFLWYHVLPCAGKIPADVQNLSNLQYINLGFNGHGNDLTGVPGHNEYVVP